MLELVSTPHLLSMPAKQIAYLSRGVLKQVTHDMIKIKVMLNLFQHPTRKAGHTKQSGHLSYGVPK
jgi:hypothetical protein